MTFSIARERYTPLLSSALNFDGIVSRFFVSRLCSKVPVKAKAHGESSRSGEEAGQSIPDGGVGGAPPSGNGFAHATYPTSPHSATRNPHNVPHFWIRAKKARNLQGFQGGTDFAQNCRAGCIRGV